MLSSLASTLLTPSPKPPSLWNYFVVFLVYTSSVSLCKYKNIDCLRLPFFSGISILYTVLWLLFFNLTIYSGKFPYQYIEVLFCFMFLLNYCCWAGPRRPASSVLAQPQDLGKSPESAKSNQWLNDGGPYMSEARSWRNTPPCVRHTGRQDMGQSSLRRWGRWLPVTGVIDVRWTHRLPGKLAEGQAPHCPFDKLSRWRCLDLKIRTITGWGREQVCRHLLIRLYG